jgi:bcr-type benzoyl-CoA reductase subunit C
MMSRASDRMISIVRNAPEVLHEMKTKTRQKMIGFFHPVVPEELIYAAGLHPVQLFPFYNESITVGDAYLQTFLCSILRADWDQIKKGKHPFLDGAIIPRSCEAVTFLYQTWKRHNPYQFIDYINVPWKRSENTISFFAKELGRVKKNLEKFTGKEISKDSLQNATKVYNRNRELLRTAYELRKSEAPPISGSEAIHMVMSSFLLNKKEHNGLMEELLTELSQRPQRPKKHIRILISGGCSFDVRLWDTIESAGALIVADDVNNGSRSFWHSVEERTKDPLKALAKGYAMVPCAFDTSIMDRFRYVSEMITEYKVNGVIFAINRNCESEKFVYPELNKKIKEKFNIPTLNIETDYLGKMAQLRNRIEAFMEILSD